MNKHDKSPKNTSIIASHLMNKMIHTQNQYINLHSYQQTQQQSLLNHSQLSSPIKLPQHSQNPNHMPQQPHQQFRLNIQYHQPQPIQQNNTSNLSKLKNYSKLKPIRQLQLTTEKQRNSKILRHLKKNLFFLHFDKTKQTQLNQTLFVKTQSHQSLKNKKQIHAKQVSDHTKIVLSNQNKQLRQIRQPTYIGQNISQRQKSPSKVSVNFQLYFPKDKLRTTINHITRPQQRRSININGLQKEIFRIKKSSKSVSLHQQNQKPILEFDQNTTQLKKQRQTLQQQVLVSLRQNSAKKYIQKVQKFKKFKDNKISKQPLFGLNVTQAEYHEFRLDHEGKRFKTKNIALENLKNQVQNQQTSFNEQKRNSFKIDRNELHHQKQIAMNLTMTEGQSILLDYNTQSFISQLKPILSIKKSRISQQQRKSPSQKSPSEHKIITKNFIPMISQNQRKKTYLKGKAYDQFQNIGTDNLLKAKIIGMLNCLDIVLNSYCCKIVNQSYEKKDNQQLLSVNKSFIASQLRDINQQSIKQLSKSNAQPKYLNQNMSLLSQQISQPYSSKIKQKFYFFVGNGNNKNLIRSIMKKRGWWAQTQKIQNANFVWTQLKVTDVLQKQQKMSQKLIQEPDSWHFKTRQTDVTPVRLQKPKKSKINFESMQKFDKIFHKSMLPIYYKKLTQKQKQFQHLRTIKIPSIVHNHYDANYMIGNKKALFYNITEYCQYKKINPNSIIPLTFHIESIQTKQFKSWLKMTKKVKNTIWIVKPGENSNRGNGIFVEKDVNKITQHIQKHANEKHSFIIQKYMKNIFLYNKRKFDIRVYMLMSTIGGITKFYWYEEGYIRTSSQIYNTEDITDLFIHLTNDAVQAKNETYSKYEKGNKVSYTEFQRYLDINYPQQKYSVEYLVSQMKSVAEIAVRSTYAKLDKAKKVNGFQLFGLDFLVDKNFSPWLLQVNTNPCLELSSPVLERLIPRMLENMFRLTIDPLFRPPQNISKHSSYFLYDNLLEKNKFELIFDGLFDSDFQWEEICLRQKDVVYEDEDEVFESNGVQMDVAD